MKCTCNYFQQFLSNLALLFQQIRIYSKKTRIQSSFLICIYSKPKKVTFSVFSLIAKLDWNSITNSVGNKIGYSYKCWTWTRLWSCIHFSFEFHVFCIHVKMKIFYWMNHKWKKAISANHMSSVSEEFVQNRKVLAKINYVLFPVSLKHSTTFLSAI